MPSICSGHRQECLGIGLSLIYKPLCGLGQAAADRIQAAVAAEAAAMRAAEDRAEEAADARRRVAELEGHLSVAEGLQVQGFVISCVA